MFWESEIKLKKNRSVSEYYFNLMSGTKTQSSQSSRDLEGEFFSIDFGIGD